MKHHNKENCESLLQARKLFAQECKFILGAVHFSQVPNRPQDEVAFAGRSNVGKSSLVNALVGQKSLAHSSTSPGRTRQLNFFDVGARLTLVDLPGYGYARAPRSEIASWTRLVQEYLGSRGNLRRVCLLVDARRGLMDNDLSVMSLLDEAAVSYLIVLTKTDKIDGVDLRDQMGTGSASIAKRPAAYPSVVATSARFGSGIDELRLALAPLAQPKI